MKSFDFRSLLIGILASFLLMLSLGAYEAKEIEADKIKARVFQIVDSKGKDCGVFKVSEAGAVTLSLGGFSSPNKFSVYVTQKENPQGGNVNVKIDGHGGEMRLTSGPGPFQNKGPVIYIHNRKQCGLSLGLTGVAEAGVFQVWNKDGTIASIPPTEDINTPTSGF